MKRILLISSLLLFTTVGLSGVSNTLATGSYDEQAVSDTIKYTRKETDKFVEVINKRDADTFIAKAPITDHGRTEYLWLTDITHSDGMFIGVISNGSGIATNIKYGQKWKVRKEDTSDWMYTRGDKIHGSYTIDPLLVTYPKEEACELGVKLVR